MVENIGRAAGEPHFEIAVYRVSPERWREELAEEDERVRDSLGPPGEHRSEASYEQHFMRLQEAHRDQVGDFPYGQAIGWLRLIHDAPGPVIKGYSYKLPWKRIGRSFRQTFFREVGSTPSDRRGSRG